MMVSLLVLTLATTLRWALATDGESYGIPQQMPTVAVTGQIPALLPLHPADFSTNVPLPMPVRPPTAWPDSFPDDFPADPPKVGQ